MVLLHVYFIMINVHYLVSYYKLVVPIYIYYNQRLLYAYNMAYSEKKLLY